MFLSTKYLDIKQGQDYSFHSNDSLVICDGVGSFQDSDLVAREIVNIYFARASEAKFKINEKLKEIRTELKDKSLKGSSTFLNAQVKDKDKLLINYLGDGGILHLKGDFAKNTINDIPYQYANCLLPHKNSKGELTRYISADCTDERLLVSSSEYTLNHEHGNIFLLFTDGISSLDENLIVQHNDAFWRTEPNSIQIILKELHTFLIQNCNSSDFKKKLDVFIKDVLNKLNVHKQLEDDVALGVVITDDVLTYYQQKEQEND